MSTVAKIVFFIALLSLSFGIFAASKTTITFLYIGADNHDAVYGLEQGIKEANLQAQFLGQYQYQLRILTANNWQRWGDFSAKVIFTVLDESQYRQLLKAATGVPVFNLNLTDNALRSDCLPNALHVIPSIQMYTDAKWQWQQKNPNSKARVMAWHSDFTKFAARDLNKRFFRTHQKKMKDISWAGWAAAKMSSDSIARVGDAESSVLLDYLKEKMESFDGQKGDNLSFRQTGQLQQLMLLVEQDQIVGEAPVRGVAKSLDSLGLTSCAK